MSNTPKFLLSDLHMHSVHSDGFFTPSEIVARLKKRGVQAAALTDHDSVSGCAEFLAAAEQAGVYATTGIEISAYEEREIHILGYGMDISAPEFMAYVSGLHDYRNERNQKILKKLREIKGIPLDYAEVRNPNGCTSRVHIAAAMVKKGLIGSFKEAYSLMVSGGACYVEHFALTVSEAARAISQAGGVPVLAHPHRLEADSYKRRALIKRFAESGVQGIESRYKTHTKAEKWQKPANEFGLFGTAGGDFHGAPDDEFYPRGVNTEILTKLGFKLNAT